MTSGHSLGKARVDKAGLKRNGALDSLILERSETVLWTIAPPGIVLHNFARRKFMQLDAVGYSAWGFLDGARTVGEVIERTTPHGKPALRKRLHSVIRTLAYNGFIVERVDV